MGKEQMIKEIGNNIHDIQHYVKGFSFAMFKQNHQIVDACLFQLMFAGLGKYILENYRVIEKSRIWNTIKNDLPLLKKDLLDYSK